MNVIVGKLIRKFKLNDIMFFCASPFSHKTVDGDICECRKVLEDFSPKPKGTSIGKNHISENPKYDVQVIVPVYNAEKYLRECLDSILGQKTDYKIYIVIIDDGSTDGSGNIADEYKKLENVRVIHQENAGAAEARNTALRYINARYVTFVDADDMLEPFAIQNSTAAADFYHADMVEGGVYKLCDGKKTVRVKEKTVKRIKSLHDAHGMPWGGIYAASVFANITFPAGYYYEDTMNGFILIPQVHNGYSIPEMFYDYRDNPASVTYKNAYKPKVIDTYWITEQMVSEHESMGLPHDTYFRDMFLSQVVCNFKRLKATPEKIQKAVFVMTCDLAKSVNISGIASKRHSTLVKALNNRDFGLYQLYCKTR